MLEEYREEFARFNEAITRENYLHYSGQKTELALGPIYDRYGHLFTPEAIEDLKRERDSAPQHFETLQKGIDLLIAFAQEKHLESQVHHLQEQIAQAETQARIYWDDEEITFSQAALKLATEPDAKCRRSLQAERVKVIRKTNDLRSDRLRILRQSAKTLGHENSLALYRQNRSWDFDHLSSQCLQLLEQTEEIYQTQLSRALADEMGLTPELADRADLDFFLRLNRYSEFFPKEGIRAAYRETMRLLEIDVEKQRNIEIDDEERPGKHPRAFCAPIRVPEEIKLVTLPIGGQDNYHAFFHQAGRAQHYGWTASRLQPEFKYAGDHAVGETFGLLFDSLILDPRWLEEVLHFPATESFVKLGALHKLFHVRRWAAMFEYERMLHAGTDLEAASGYYAELLSRATGFRYPPEEFLLDLDDGFFSGDLLRASQCEVLLRDHLKTRFGHRWWKSERAAEFLIDVWSTGERYTVEELAALLDLDSLSMEPLVFEVTQTLRIKRR